MQFNAEFYALNRAQHFSFPHAYCDQIADDELARQFYDLSYFPAHIAAYYGGEPSKVVAALRAVPHATTCAAVHDSLHLLISGPRLSRCTIPPQRRPLRSPPSRGSSSCLPT